MDHFFRLPQLVLQFVQGSASPSSSETMKEISDISDDLQSVRRTSAWIKDVLADAEERALRGEKLVQQWLTDLHHLDYRASDLLGLYEYEVVAQQIRYEEASATAAAKGKSKLDQVHNSSPLSDPSFRREFALGIHKFREDFDEINKLKEALRFDEEDGEKSKKRGIDMLEHLPTGSEPEDDLFFGTENKLRELIGYLLADDPNCKRVPVIALVGMGGVGKTTLAQHAFKDPKVCEFYSMRGWVCVSDNFHVQSLTRSTLEAFNSRSNDKEFAALQTCLKAVAKKKRFLLVLDDVWNEDVKPWDTFYSSLRAGAKGSKIIITTRSKTVAGITQAMQRVDVSCLSNEDAWNFFQTVVFGDHGNQHELDHPALTDVGKKITERCKGLPLAIKVLGRYLRCYIEDLYIWYAVLESKLLQPLVLEADDNQVFGPLMLSYINLPACVKPCFVLSSVFPKDTKIKKGQLIDLWIAHERVEDCNENTGMLYIRNLVDRSFFEIRKDSGKEYITIHDIIHDLAMCLSRDKMLHETNVDGPGKNLLISEEVQHAFISTWDASLKFGMTDTSGLRTLHVKGSTEKLRVDPDPVNLNSLRSLMYKTYSDRYFPYAYSKKLKNLRHLELRNISPVWVTHEKLDAIGILYNLRTLKIKFEADDGISLPVSICNLRQLFRLTLVGIRDVPDSIGCLTKLCKLCLSGRQIEYLPDTISKLINLKEMDLSCGRMIWLPKSIGNLKALRVLDLKCCAFLGELPASICELKALEVLSLPAPIGLPVGIKRLTKLQQLEVFFLGDEDTAGIEELRELVHIKGRLSICGLENVATQEEAEQSELYNKRHIRELLLEWREAAENEQVLEGLRPHANLECLCIYGWSGNRLASWLGDTSFVNLQEICIERTSCKSLTPIHQLPSLKSLKCINMSSLLYLTPPCSDSDVRTSCFPALKRLEFNGCPSLVFLADSMPLLKDLELRFCDSMRMVTPIHQLPSLKSLKCTGMSSLQYLTPPCSDSDSDIRNSCFPALERLEFYECPSLVFLADSMPLLKDLDLTKCDSMRALPCPLDSLPSLEHLRIADCVSLDSISFDNLPALAELYAYNCSSLRFSDSTVFPSSLRRLRINKCPQAANWCRAHRQSHLAHLPKVYESSDNASIDFSKGTASLLKGAS